MNQIKAGEQEKPCHVDINSNKAQVNWNKIAKKCLSSTLDKSKQVSNVKNDTATSIFNGLTRKNTEVFDSDDDYSSAGESSSIGAMPWIFKQKGASLRPSIVHPNSSKTGGIRSSICIRKGDLAKLSKLSNKKTEKQATIATDEKGNAISGLLYVFYAVHLVFVSNASRKSSKSLCICIDVKMINRWQNKKKATKRKKLKKAEIRSNTVDDTEFSDISFGEGNVSQPISSVRQHFRPIHLDSVIHPKCDDKTSDKSVEKKSQNNSSSARCCIIC